MVGGSLGLAVLSAVSTSQTTSALDDGSTLPAALTHGFTGAFTVSAILCAAAAVLAIVLLPGRRREPEDVHVETVAMASSRCPGAPYSGHLARVAAWAIGCASQWPVRVRSPARAHSASGPRRAVSLDHRDLATTAHLIHPEIETELLAPFANQEAETQ